MFLRSGIAGPYDLNDGNEKRSRIDLPNIDARYVQMRAIVVAQTNERRPLKAILSIEYGEERSRRLPEEAQARMIPIIRCAYNRLLVAYDATHSVRQQIFRFHIKSERVYVKTMRSGNKAYQTCVRSVRLLNGR